MKSLYVFLAAVPLLGVGMGSAVRAQSIAKDVVIDKHLPTGEPLEKAIDYFTSTTFPSVVVGNGRGGLYLYQSASGELEGPWKRCTR